VTWYDDGGNKPPHEPVPSGEVPFALILTCTACGAEMRAGGEGWRHEPDCQVAALWQTKATR
jgi:hypothetical protein